MENAKYALKSFLRNLPAGSQFSIMNFGAEFDMLQIEGEDSGELTENNLNHAFQAIGGYTANMKQKDL